MVQSPRLHIGTMRAVYMPTAYGLNYRASRCPVCGEHYEPGPLCEYGHEPWECCHLHDRPIMARGRWWTAADTWAVMAGGERHGRGVLGAAPAEV